MSYRFGREVDADLEAIWEYIAQDNLEAAHRWNRKFFDAFEALAKAPAMGHLRSDLTSKPVRFWPVGSYLVIYRAESLPIEIVAVTQGARDVPVFLHQRIGPYVSRPDED
jgi:plasmid stabilization system protein ParE